MTSKNETDEQIEIFYQLLFLDYSHLVYTWWKRGRCVHHICIACRLSSPPCPWDGPFIPLLRTLVHSSFCFGLLICSSVLPSLKSSFYMYNVQSLTASLLSPKSTPTFGGRLGDNFCEHAQWLPRASTNQFSFSVYECTVQPRANSLTRSVLTFSYLELEWEKKIIVAKSSAQKPQNIHSVSANFIAMNSCK